MIVFLNGSINAGKSTVAKLLCKELSNCALLEIDSLREMIDWMPIDKAVPINLENAASLIRNFIGRGFDVVVPYPLSQKNYDYLLEKLKDLDAEVLFFTLAPRLETALSDRGVRKLDEIEKKRVKHHYNIGITKPSFGEIIDNTSQTPEETAEVILTKIKARGR
jgi:adenylate kinase family enzyme